MNILKRKDSDMTQGVIWKHLLEFSIPMTIGLLFQQLYNTVDTVVVGRFVGKEALAAVGSTGNIINMLVGLGVGFTTGAGVVISQAYGAHEEDRLSKAVHTTLSVTFILCLVMTVIGVLVTRPMLIAMKTPYDVLDQAQVYLTIYFAGISGLFLYNAGSSILRAIGDSTRPLYFLILSAVLNIVFDLVFVLVFHMDVAGVALATVLTQLISAVLVLLVLSRSREAYGIRWRKLGIHKETMKQMLSIGLPSGIQQGLTSFSNVFVQAYINDFGSAVMAGWTVCNKLDAFITLPIQSFALASMTFVGQNVGASDYKRAKKGVNEALMMSIGISLVLTALVIPLRYSVLKLFTSEADVLLYGARFVLIISPFYVAMNFNQILSGAIRGVGDGKTPMYIMLGSFVLFRQAFLFISKLLGGGFVTVALAYPMGWVCCSTLMIIAYYRSVLGTCKL